MALNKYLLSSSLFKIQSRKLSFLNKGLTSVEAELHLGSFPAVKLIGLPYNFIPKDIINFLDGIQPVDMVVQFKKGSPTGSVAVLFSNNNDAKLALSYNKKYIGSRYINVIRCRRDEYYHIIHHDVRMRRPSVPPKNMRNAQAVIKIEGLSYETLPIDVYKFCSDYISGEDCVIVAGSENGNPSGVAFVELESIELAQRAQSELDKKYLGIRKIHVSLSSGAEASSVPNYYFD